MTRRDFLRSVAAGTLVAPVLRGQTPAPGQWHAFEVTTHVHVQNATGITRVWLPTPLAVAPYQKTLGDTYHVDAGTVSMIEREDIDVLAAEWPAGADPILTLTCRVATLERAVDLATPGVPPPRDFSGFTRFLRTGAAAGRQDLEATAATITRGAGTDLERARALYDAIAGEDQRDPRADPNARYVALARVSGIPARLVYGLGLGAADATRAQLARAEVYLVGYGWVPAGFGRGGRFGSWTLDWMAYNSAQDVVLPGSTRGALASVMHPQAETGHIRVDSLNAEAFRYEIGVRGIEA
jgi:hypothetical protein